MLAFLSGFFGAFRKRLIIIAIIIGVIVLGYFYISNMKSKIGDLQKKSGVQETVIEIQDKTIETLTKRIDRTQEELDKIASRVKKNKKNLDNIVIHFDSGKMKESFSENKNKSEEIINDKLNELFDYLSKTDGQPKNAKESQTDEK